MASIITANPPKPPRTLVSEEQQNGDINEEKERRGSISSASSKSSTPESVAPSVLRENSADELEDWQRTNEDRKPDANTEDILKVI